jgi:hypothetical protein
MTRIYHTSGDDIRYAITDLYLDGNDSPGNYPEVAHRTPVRVIASVVRADRTRDLQIKYGSPLAARTAWVSEQWVSTAVPPFPLKDVV